MTTQYMLLIRNEGMLATKLSPREFGELMKKFEVWTKKLIDEGSYAGGEKLTNDLGRTLRYKKSAMVVDGPYADTKDAVGGFYIINAANLEAAIEVAKGCPSLAYGDSVEVREVEQMNQH